MRLIDLLQNKQDSASCLLATGNLEFLLVSAQPRYIPQVTCQSWAQVKIGLGIFKGSTDGSH